MDDHSLAAKVKIAQQRTPGEEESAEAGGARAQQQKGAHSAQDERQDCAWRQRATHVSSASFAPLSHCGTTKAGSFTLETHDN